MGQQRMPRANISSALLCRNQFLCTPFTLTLASGKLPSTDHRSSTDDVHTVQQGCPTGSSQGKYLWPLSHLNKFSTEIQQI